MIVASFRFESPINKQVKWDAPIVPRKKTFSRKTGFCPLMDTLKKKTKSQRKKVVVPFLLNEFREVEIYTFLCLFQQAYVDWAQLYCKQVWHLRKKSPPLWVSRLFFPRTKKKWIDHPYVRCCYATCFKKGSFRRSSHCFAK